ncbi:MAG: hypothetical protein RBT69_13050 [Spirochaetia bacterium]|jgi:uncharacterized membrane protein|nr:hypothetical protein [Spirochaetia bacterium]
MVELHDISSVIIYFSVCSFMGWVLESVIFRLYQDAQFKNAGFLYGPFVPVYGFGGVLIYISSLYLQIHPFWIIIVFCAIILTALEYITSVFMEKVFSIKLWDYSGYRFNLNGRICLKLTILWTIFAAIQIRWTQPALINLITSLPEVYRDIFSSVLVFYFCLDLIFSSRLYLGYSSRIRDILSSEKHADLSGIFKMNLSIKDFRLFIRPMKQFPNLSLPVKKRWHSLSSLVLEKTRQWAGEFTNLPGEKPYPRNSWMMDKDFLEISSPITENPEYQRLKGIRQNDRSVFDHNIAVAYLACRIAKNFQMNKKAIVRGALLRNFEYYSNYCSSQIKKQFENRHRDAGEGDDSLKYTALLFGPVSTLERDIILKHRWPYTLIPPHYPEAIIVMIADKLISIKE